MEGHLGGVGLAVGREHLDTPVGGQGRDLAHQAALADTRGPDHGDDRTVALDGTLQQALDGPHLPVPTHQSRLGTLARVVPVWQAHQPPGGHRLVGALDVDQLRVAQGRHGLDQPGGGAR